MLTRVLAICVVVLFAFAVAGCISSGTGAQSTAKAGSGEALMNQKCTMCHSLDRINGAIYDAAKWSSTISRMQQNGLVVTEQEKELIVQYLAERDASR